MNKEFIKEKARIENQIENQIVKLRNEINENTHVDTWRAYEKLIIKHYQMQIITF